MSVPIGHALKHDKKYSIVPTSGSQGGWIWRKRILKKQPLGLHEAKSLRCSLAVMPPGVYCIICLDSSYTASLKEQ